MGQHSLKTLWQISSKDPGPKAQGPSGPTPPWARSSKDLVAHLLHGPGVLKTWEHGALTTSQRTFWQDGQAPISA